FHTRQDIPVHYMLADAFTVCDNYHCSLLGPTLPNRLYWFGATIDPAGTNGGPQLVQPNIAPVQKFSWRIMPENLSDAGVSWKVYAGSRQNAIVDVIGSTYGPVPQFFKQSADPRSDLARFGNAPVYPRDFVNDVKNNRLPQVSWLVPFFF